MNSLKQKTISGFIWDLGGLIFSQVISFVISIVLARLLQPSDYGLLAMSGVFVFIFNIFIDVGFSSALIQRNDNTNLTYSSIFYINIFSSIVIFFLLQFAAPYIGAFYKNDKIIDIVRLISFLLPIGALSNVQNTILNKEMNFSFLTKRNLISQLFGGVVGVIAAFNGYGVYSLIISSFASQILSTIMIWSVSTWKPDFKFSMEEVRKVFKFSLYVFLVTFTGKIFTQLNSLFIGKLFSSSTLGFYNMAVGVRDRVSTLTSSSTKKVLFPVMSSLKDHDEKFIYVYNKAINIIGFFSFLIIGVIYFWCDALITICYGVKWLASIPILKVLILTAILTPIGSLMVDALISKGFAKENFVLDSIKKVTAIMVLLSGYFFGFQVMMYTFLLQTFLNIILNIIYLKIYLDFPLKEVVLKMIYQVLIITLCIFLYENLTMSSYIIKDLVFSVIYFAVYIAYQYLFEKDNFKYIFGMFKSFI